MSLFLQEISMKFIHLSSALLCLYVGRIICHTYDFSKFKSDYHIKSWKYPYTVSQMQSETVIGRNNLTFILCIISSFFVVNQICRYESYICLVHLTLSVMCIFPTGTDGSHEVVIFIETDKKHTHIMHMVLVGFYIVLSPTLYFFFIVPDAKVFILIIVGAIFIFSALKESKYQLPIELFLIGLTLYVFSNLEK